MWTATIPGTGNREALSAVVGKMAFRLLPQSSFDASMPSSLSDEYSLEGRQRDVFA